jgi:DNA polymerase III epsilon subunit-like protein
MYLFFDTETTGVTNFPRIVQIGWVLTDENGNELRTHCFIIRPDGFEIPLSATRIHGITTEVAHRSGLEIAAALEAFAKDVMAAESVVAHNVHFDRNVVRDEFSRVNGRDIFVDRNLYCTMRASTNFCKISGLSSPLVQYQ